MTEREKTDLELYRILYRIRRFEETVLENFPRGVFYGTTHTYLGQEANAAGVISALQENDLVFSNHRCHGHFLAYGGSPQALFAEMMGKASGVCSGRGGSQHLHWRNFYSNGIQGGIAPLAVGMALAEKYKGSQAVTLAFLGDGTLGEGVLYESLNMASLWQAPIVFIVENNHIAQTTPLEISLAGEIAARFSAFGIPSEEIDSSDVRQIAALAHPLIELVRAGSGPRALILHTCRFGPHSKGDDTRPMEQIAHLRAERDPVRIQAQRLAHKPRLAGEQRPADEQRLAVEKAEDASIAQAFQAALAEALPIREATRL